MSWGGPDGAKIWGKKSHERQVLDLSEWFEPDEIAEKLCVDVIEVTRVLDGLGSKPGVVVMCHHTRRCTLSRSWRQAYRRLCTGGLSAWSWCSEPVFRAWLASNGVAEDQMEDMVKGRVPVPLP